MYEHIKSNKTALKQYKTNKSIMDSYLNSSMYKHSNLIIISQYIFIILLL
ncbi:hypothetical protein SAMN05421820_102655 [Pedobacter steynii]|uniref:Uncharacterized protein n=1 Tax=Pedobacter steynii TaxID=430522 RepID=A0A1G9PHC5_9SPHI|nr:hypothetical protein SAMN05421820_102655 [Pedobacter steynii]